MKISQIVLSVATALLSAELAAAAPIATISKSSGQVSVQTAKGIVPASPGTQLSEGDRLAIGLGSATVSYQTGKCKGSHEIGPQSIAVISNSGDRCVKRVEGAKAQTLGPGVPDELLAPVGLLAVGGGVAAALGTSGGGGGGSGVIFPPISP